MDVFLGEAFVWLRDYPRFWRLCTEKGSVKVIQVGMKEGQTVVLGKFADSFDFECAF